MHTTGNMDGTAAASGGIIAKVGFNRWRFLLEGQRVELNAMTSDQFVDFVERKLAEAGIEKVDLACVRARRDDGGMYHAFKRLSF